MSDKKTILQKAAEKLKTFMLENVNLDNMGSAVIDENGTEVMWEGDLSEGVALTIEVEGEPTIAPEGTHTFMSGDMEGTTVVLDADGIVQSIAAPGEEELEEELTKEESLAIAAMQTDQINKLTKRLDAFEKENTELKAKVEKLAAAPDGEPTKKKTPAKPNTFGLESMNPLFHSLKN